MSKASASLKVIAWSLTAWFTLVVITQQSIPNPALFVMVLIPWAVMLYSAVQSYMAGNRRAMRSYGVAWLIFAVAIATPGALAQGDGEVEVDAEGRPLAANGLRVAGTAAAAGAIALGCTVGAIFTVGASCAISLGLVVGGATLADGMQGWKNVKRVGSGFADGDIADAAKGAGNFFSPGFGDAADKMDEGEKLNGWDYTFMALESIPLGAAGTKAAKVGATAAKAGAVTEAIPGKLIVQGSKVSVAADEFGTVAKGLGYKGAVKAPASKAKATQWLKDQGYIVKSSKSNELTKEGLRKALAGFKKPSGVPYVKNADKLAGATKAQLAAKAAKTPGLTSKTFVTQGRAARSVNEASAYVGRGLKDAGKGIAKAPRAAGTGIAKGAKAAPGIAKNIVFKPIRSIGAGVSKAARGIKGGFTPKGMNTWVRGSLGARNSEYILGRPLLAYSEYVKGFKVPTNPLAVFDDLCDGDRQNGVEAADDFCNDAVRVGALEDLLLCHETNLGNIPPEFEGEWVPMFMAEECISILEENALVIADYCTYIDLEGCAGIQEAGGWLADACSEVLPGEWCNDVRDADDPLTALFGAFFKGTTPVIDIHEPERVNIDGSTYYESYVAVGKGEGVDCNKLNKASRVLFGYMLTDFCEASYIPTSIVVGGGVQGTEIEATVFEGLALEDAQLTLTDYAFVVPVKVVEGSQGTLQYSVAVVYAQTYVDSDNGGQIVVAQDLIEKESKSFKYSACDNCTGDPEGQGSATGPDAEPTQDCDGIKTFTCGVNNADNNFGGLGLGSIAKYWYVIVGLLVIIAIWRNGVLWRITKGGLGKKPKQALTIHKKPGLKDKLQKVVVGEAPPPKLKPEFRERAPVLLPPNEEGTGPDLKALKEELDRIDDEEGERR